MHEMSLRIFSSISSEQGKGKARGGACWEGARFTCQKCLLLERGPAQGGLCILTMALKEGGFDVESCAVGFSLMGPVHTQYEVLGE